MRLGEMSHAVTRPVSTQAVPSCSRFFLQTTQLGGLQIQHGTTLSSFLLWPQHTPAECEHMFAQLFSEVGLKRWYCATSQMLLLLAPVVIKKRSRLKGVIPEKELHWMVQE